MTDPRVEQIVNVLVRYSLDIQPGETLYIQADVAAEPLLREVYRGAIRAGAFVTTQISFPGLGKIFMDEANEKQLKWVNPFYKMAVETFDAYLSIGAPTNTQEGTGYDPKKRAIKQEATQPIFDTFLKRFSDGEFKWCGTQFPTHAAAQDANMEFEDYEQFVFNACLPDRENPIGFWREMETRQDRLIERLNTVGEIRLVAPDTDLTVNVDGRTWINCAGRENFPDGEVFTGPVEDKTEVHVSFTYPAVHMGNEVVGAQLFFEKGRVVKATATKGEDFLLHMLDSDEGARVLGEFAIGTNPGIQTFTRNTLFDEKIQGTVHMAVGMSFPESGGQNQSQVHWDMVCDMREGGQLFADGELIYENGAFTIDFE